MRPEIQAYLDGEVRLSDLPPELHEQAKGWDLLMADLDESGTPAMAPAWIESNVMAEIQDRRRPGLTGFLAWLVEPKPIRVPPLAIGLGAAAVIALLVVPRGSTPEVPGTTPAGAAVAAATTVTVQFVLEAPGATSVAVAGDFSGWEAQHTLVDPEGDGVWTARIAVEPGVHEYMFVIDGTEWVTDPDAEQYRDDGFGNRNAVLTALPTA